MIKSFAPVEWSMLQTQFQEKRDKQLMQSISHEAAENYSMAYLALWAVLEFFAKRVGPIAQRQELKVALSAWLNYLDVAGEEIPAKIAAGKFDLPKLETGNIPPQKSLQELFPLSAGQNFYSVIASKGKFRNRRNEIAHSGASVTQKVYKDFKAAALAAVSEIDSWLAGDIV